MPKVSIIIPTYNRANIISNTIESIYHQTFSDFEIIVIDDGSVDNTQEVLKKFPQVNYLSIPHTGLPAIARNKGIKIAKGDLIAFLDSDDIWMPEKIKKQIDILNTNEEVGLISTNAYVIGKENTGSQIYLKYGQGKSGEVLSDLIVDNFLITSSIITRKKLIETVGMFPEDCKYRAIEDYYLWLKISAISKIKYIDEPLVCYRDENNSIRSQQKKINYYVGLYYLYTDLMAFIKNLPNKHNLISQINKRIEDTTIDIYQESLACGDLDSCIWSAKKLFKSHFSIIKIIKITIQITIIKIIKWFKL